MTTVLLSLLVRRSLDLDGDTSSSLVLLDNVLGLVVELERSTTRERGERKKQKKERRENVHLTELDDLPLLRLRVDLDDAERCTDAKSTLDDIDTENDG